MDAPTVVVIEDDEPAKKIELEDELEEMIPIKEEGFRFANQKAWITIPTWIDKYDYEQHIIKAVNGQIKTKFKFFRMAHETGHGNTPYNHTHILIDFGKAFQTYKCRFFDYPEGNHAHIAFVKTMLHWKRCVNYLAKEDKENADLKDKPSWVAQAQNCKTRQEAALLAHKPNDLAGLMMAYDMKPLVVSIPLPELKRWQVECERDILALDKKTTFFTKDDSSSVNYGHWDNDVIGGRWIDGTAETRGDFKSGTDRHINVIYNPGGCIGKSVFIASMMAKYPDKVLGIEGLGNSRDVATMISGAMDRGWDGSCVLINLTRSAADHKIYAPLEAIRDGMMTSQKYTGRTMLWDCKSVWMFVNWMPKLDAVSEDRWIIWGISSETNLRKHISLGEAKRIYAEESMKRMGMLADSLRSGASSPAGPGGLSTSWGIKPI